MSGGSNSVGAYQVGTWTFTGSVSGNVAVNNFPAVTLPWQTQCALGQVAGSAAHRTFGINPNVGAADELISPDGLAAPYLPTAAVSIEVNSANVNDTAAGTGGIDTAAAPFAPRMTRREYNQADGQIDWSYENSPIVIGEKTDFWISASAAGAPNVSAEFIGILRAN